MNVNRYTIPIFRPYRESALTPLTLYEVLRDEYLSQALVWLLGHNGDIPFNKSLNAQIKMRAQVAENIWQFAWGILDLLSIREIFSSDQVHQNLINEIDRTLVDDNSMNNGVTWLLQQAHYDGDFVHWRGQLFDTCLASRALLQLRASYSEQFDAPKNNEITQCIHKSIHWVIERIIKNDAPEMGNGTLAQIIMTLIQSNSLSPSIYNALSKQYADDADNLIVFVITLLLGRKQELEGTPKWSVKPQKWGSNEIEGFAKALEWLSDDKNSNPSLFDEVWTSLLGGLLSSEKILREGGDHARLARKLAAYVEGHKVAHKCLIESEYHSVHGQWDNYLVLSRLQQLCHDARLHGDGSIYGDAYTTYYYVHSLVYILQNWSYVRNIVTIAYDDAVSIILYDKQISDERWQIYDMHRIEYKLNQEIKHQKNLTSQSANAWENLHTRYSKLEEQNTALLLLISTSVIILMAISLLGWIEFHLPAIILDNLVEWIALVGGIVGALATLVVIRKRTQS